MRSRDPPGWGPAACGTTAASGRALTCGRAGAETSSSGGRVTSTACLPRSKAARKASRPRAAIAASRARATSGCRKAGIPTPVSSRRPSAWPSRVAARSGSLPFGGDHGEHLAATPRRRPGGRRWGRCGSGTGGSRRPGTAPALRWRHRRRRRHAGGVGAGPPCRPAPGRSPSCGARGEPTPGPAGTRPRLAPAGRRGAAPSRGGPGAIR